MSASSVTGKLDYNPVLPRNKSVGIGCIGSGFIMADCHLVAYEQAGFRPLAIASRTPMNARAVAKKRNVPKAYETYQELLADKKSRLRSVAVDSPDSWARKDLAFDLKHERTTTSLVKAFFIE